MIPIRTHYYRQYDADFTREVPEEGFLGWTIGDVEVDPKRVGLVLMHVWDYGPMEANPGAYRSESQLSRTYEVTRRVLPGLLDATRAAEIPVFYTVLGSGYYEQYPGYARAVEAAGPEEPALLEVERDESSVRLRRFHDDHIFVGKHNQADSARAWKGVRLSPLVEPQPCDGIAKNAYQLTALCRAAGVNHLVYAGFNLDSCILMAPGGMVDMNRRGAICSVLRDAVTACENRETARHEAMKEIGLWRVSVELGGLVLDTADFIAWLKRIPGL
jgi:hypothetical protein